MVSNLTSRPTLPRDQDVTSAPDRNGIQTLYPPAPEARLWPVRLEEAEEAGGDPFTQACFAYAQVALSHPYADGNGRLARAIFQRAFARAGLLSIPLIPMGPLIYLHHRRVITGLRRLGMSGEWEPLIATLAHLSLAAMSFTKSELEAQAS